MPPLFDVIKLVLAGVLTVIRSRIVFSATEYALFSVIPWLLGAVRPPPAARW